MMEGVIGELDQMITGNRRVIERPFGRFFANDD